MARIRGTKNDDVLNGTSASDILIGDDGNDRLIGGLGNDRLNGGDGDDILNGGEGNDVYVGGTGTDTAVFLDNIQNYSFKSLKKGIKISHQDGDGADGIDKVEDDVENLQFENTTVKQQGDPGNYAPAVFADAAATDEETSVSIDVVANDIDVNSDTLRVTAINEMAVTVGDTITLVSGARVTVNSNATVSYDPSGAFNSLGGDEQSAQTFGYTISDGHGGSAEGMVTVTVNGVNDDPAITLIALSVNENQTLAGTVTATDPENDTLIYSITGNGADDDKFIIDPVTGELRFVTAPDFENPTDEGPDPDGIYQVEVQVADNNGGLDSRLINVTVQDVNEQPEFALTIDDPDPTSQDQFGTSVATDGNLILIGEPFHDTSDGTDVGRAQLFNATTGTLLQTFENPNPSTNDWFGFSVAIDGNYVLIGAPFANSLKGQAYLFNATTGDLLQTFDDPTATSQDLFGTSVAIDGNNVLIGAPRDDSLGNDVGQAHLFDATTGDLLQTFDNPTPSDADLFGSSVAISGDYAVIGEPGDDTTGTNVGQAHFFNLQTSSISADVSGTSDANELIGTMNDDIINGTADDDILRALEGDDTLDGGPGRDTLEGGPGADTFVLADLDLADLIADYNSAEGDLIDFTALFSADRDGTDPNIDELSDFVRLVESGDGAVDQLQVDVNGGASADNFTTVATLDGDAGVSVIFDDGGVDTTGFI